MLIANYPQWVENKIITKGDIRIIENFFGLSGEAGEVTEKVKKLLRDETRFSDEDVAKELGDIVFYATAIANIYNLGLPTFETAKGDIKIENSMVLDTAMLIATTGKVLEGLPFFLNNENADSNLIEELQTLLAQTVLWVIQVGRHFNADMQMIIDINVEKLDGRAERGTIQGSGDNR